jgi:hypothetical protein
MLSEASCPSPPCGLPKHGNLESGSRGVGDTLRASSPHQGTILSKSTEPAGLSAFRSFREFLSIHHWIYRDTLDLAGEIKAAFGNDAEDLSATTLNDRIKIDTGNVRVTEDPSLTNIFRLDTVSLARAGDVRLS